MPRPALGARRIAARNRDVRPVPHAADNRSRYGQHRQPARNGAQDPHGFRTAQRSGRASPTRSSAFKERVRLVYRVLPSDPRRCEVCHDQNSGATQATAYLTRPTRAACGACHDDVNFATRAITRAGRRSATTSAAILPYSSGRAGFRRVHKGSTRGAGGFNSLEGPLLSD